MGQSISYINKNAITEKERKRGEKPNDKIVANRDNKINPKSAKLVLLQPAPRRFSLPSTVPSSKKILGTHIQVNPEVTVTSKRPSTELFNSTSRVHHKEPVDQEARQLAQGAAKPACWRDLYWHLIGCREFKTDEKKVRALFTWICSVSPKVPIFPNKLEGKGIRKAKEHHRIDSPDVVLPKLIEGRTNYVQAFESLLRYSGIPCVTVHGIAKSMDYKVGQLLIQKEDLLVQPQTGALPAQISSLRHSWNAAFVDGVWRLYDCTWAAQRLALGVHQGLDKSSTAVILQYETDMFYYQVEPTKLIYTHYPFEDVWQLIDPIVSIVSFATWPLLKPAFFQYGLSLFSHYEGIIAIENQLVLKLNIRPEIVGNLHFTYQLKLDGLGNIDVGSSKTRFGIHEIIPQESCVVFHFRLPKNGEYNLIIYARHSVEQLFSDVCEYRVIAKGKVKKDDNLDILPFPTTTQGNYGPTEKAAEYGLETLPRGLPSLIKSPKGTVELRFIATEFGNPIPRLTARLKSLSVKPEILENCILLRDIEASSPQTGVSMLTGTGPCVPMLVLNLYLPEPGEYALEVYAAPAGSDESTAYHLAWQFLIEAEAGKPLPPPLLCRFATMNLGPQDENWQKLGFRALSHPDPLVLVRTTGRAGSEHLLRSPNKSRILQDFFDYQSIQSQQVDTSESVEKSSQLVKTDVENNKSSLLIDREACDLHIILGLPQRQKVCLLSQLIDISGDEEKDVTDYLLQRMTTTIEDYELEPEDKSSAASGDIPNQLVNLLIRIPRGDAFYKLYLYAMPIEQNITASIPLVFTYLIDAPMRLSAAEAPYIGASEGKFVDKIKMRKATTLKMKG